VAGIGLEEARQTLAMVNLEFILDSGLASYSEEIQAGAVVRQEPRGGSSIKMGNTVRLGISLGPARVVLPDLAGRTLQEAEMTLRGIGLEMGDLATASLPGIRPGTVAAQNPPPGVPSRPSVRVGLLVASADARTAWVMPDCAGKPQESVLPPLRARGLRPERTREIVLPHYQEGLVMAQTPVAGARVQQGDSVVLTVNRRRS
jgi:beta-lactam-binding protein with PASTA domain